MNTKTKLQSILVSVLVTLACASASANTLNISLVYTGANQLDDNGVILAELGDLLSFDLVVDATERPTLGGGFDVNFDPSIFLFESYTYSGSGIILYHREPDLQDGRLFAGSYGVLHDEPLSTIATIVFRVGGLGSGEITPSGTDGISGPWIDREDNISIIDPNFSGVSVTVVPVPAAAWLLLSGLTMFVGLARRQLASAAA